MPYSDYFALAKSYHPVFSEATVATDSWKNTYPHETFIELLRKAERMLSRTDGKATHPIWIHGAYGTGKTRIAWTLKELLSCPPEELEEYFKSYPELRKESALADKLLGLKAGGRIVVAMRFSSGNLNTLDALVTAIYQSITEALKERGMDADDAASLESGILAWLDEKVNRDVLTTILKAEPYCYDGDLPDSAEKLREILASGGVHDALLSKLLKIARERKLLAINFDVASLVAWIESVIERNNLTAIAFIWDEFSDFLLANRALFGEFQKIAHASSKIPFYFIIVTHMTSLMFSEDDDTANAVKDRFSEVLISLPEYTAFKLIAHALQVKEGMESEWRQISDDINDRLEDARRSVGKMIKPGKNNQGLDVEDFRRILPIHPYAALILKNVAENFSANQRSMFDFIADPNEDARAFQYFIHHHEPGEILSVDHLWDYFYASGKGSQNFGRSGSNANIRLVMDVYASYADKYAPASGASGEDSPEQRVLKTVIMLQALRYLSPNTEHFKANAANLEIAFEGIDGLDLGQAKIIADKLVADNVLFVDQGIYQVPLGNAVDQSKINDLIATYKNKRASELVGGFSEWDVLSPNEALKARLVIRKLTADNFTKGLNSLIYEASKDWAPKVAILFARTPPEADNVRRLLDDALVNDKANNIIFIDATSTTLPQRQMNIYAEAMARSDYFRDRGESAQSQREQELADGIIRDWATQIRNGKFTIHPQRPAKPLDVASGDDVTEELKKLVQRAYPACRDFVQGVKTTHFNEKFGAAVIKAGIMGANQNPITKESIAFWLKDIGVEDYWNLLPDHPLAKLRKTLAKKAEKAFAPGGTGRMEIREILADFMAQGFMPVTLYGWLSGYLLKEFAGSQYRYSDGHVGGVMDADRLADMIDKALKHFQHPGTSYREQYIEVLTEEQRAFTTLAAKIFKLQGDEPLDRIAIELGQIAKDWGYPFWAFAHAPDAPALQDFVELFIQYLNPEAHNRAGYGEVASAIGKLILANPETEEALQKLFTQENLQKGMVNWLGSFENGELPALAAQIGAPDYLADFRSELVGDAAWLWDEKVCGDVATGILDDYHLAAKSVEKGFLSHANSRDACLEGWKQKLYGLHLPCAALQERYPDQKQILKIFDELGKGRVITKPQRLKLLEMVRENDTILHDIFENAPTTFRREYGEILKELPEKEIAGLYETLPASSFRDDRSNFEGELKVRVAAILGKLKRSQLQSKWREITGTESPAVLANQVATPMSAILREVFGSEACAEAISACKAIDNENAADAEMDLAMAFLNANSEQLRNMADPALGDEAFRNFIIGRNGAILKDNAKARERLAEKLGQNVEKWLDYPGWQEIVLGLATEEYKANGLEAVRQKLAAMAPDQAKTLLERLGEDNFEVGLRILGD